MQNCIFIDLFCSFSIKSISPAKVSACRSVNQRICLSVAQHIDDFYGSPVIHIGGDDSCGLIGSMDNPSAADIEGHMVNMAAAAVKYQIPGSGFIRRHGSSLGGLGSGCPVKVNPGCVA